MAGNFLPHKNAANRDLKAQSDCLNNVSSGKRWRPEEGPQLKVPDPSATSFGDADSRETLSLGGRRR